TDIVTAVVTDDDGSTDTETATETVTITDVLPTIVVTKTADPTSVSEPGGNVDYTVTVENTSFEDVTLTTLTDDIYGDLNGDGTCATGGTIATGVTYSCTFTGAVAGNAGDTITDIVTAVVTDDDGSTDTETATETVTVTAPTIIDPGVTKAGDPSQAQVGDTVTFTLLVFNTGDTLAENVEIEDVIPSFLDIISPVVVSWTGPGPSPPIPVPSIAGNTITINFGTVEPTDSWTVIISTVVNAQGTPPGGRNEVRLTTTSDDADPDNNFDEVFINIVTPDDQDLPETGFAPDQETDIPSQPANFSYLDLGELWLEIPDLDVETAIVGVPLVENGWDVTWLWDKAGYLDGTAFPTWAGNSVITGHVVLPNGLEGPFAHLKELAYGDRVIVNGWGERYIYEIREVDLVPPNDPSVIRHEEYPWITLVTCEGYDEELGIYRWRVAAHAVQVSVEGDTGSSHVIPYTRSDMIDEIGSESTGISERWRWYR
ncbi:MAG: sortase, partial [Anaerolineales bacterium]